MPNKSNASNATSLMADNGLGPDVLRRRAPSFRSSVLIENDKNTDCTLAFRVRRFFFHFVHLNATYFALFLLFFRNGILLNI